MTSLFTSRSLPQCDAELSVEYRALMRQYGQAQARCSEALHAQHEEIKTLRAQAIRLRAAVILRDTLIAWTREDVAGSDVLADDTVAQGEEGLEATLEAADLVICQTGCLSHGAYWRVQDHCKRTGKACVQVEQPESLRIVRIHKTRRVEAAVSN